jgi:pilus assembly protein TadC
MAQGEIESMIFQILLAGMIGMELLSVFYLRQRRMPLTAYLRWGLLAALVPFVGPFLVILQQPGQRPGQQPIRRRIKQS